MRAALIVLGLALGGYGVVLLLELPTETVTRILVWAAAGVALHDFVFAPLCAAAGLAGRRLFRGRWWTPVTVAGTCTVVLLLVAIPVYSKPGFQADNTTVLDRDYHLGLWLALAVVWAAVPLAWIVQRWVPRRVLPVGHDDAVQHDGAEHVEGKPPAV